MRAIKLSNGDFTIVDDEDFDFLLRFFPWHCVDSKGNQYAYTKRLGGVYLHVLLLQPVPPLIVRHIDDCGLHNFRSNLKIATQSENLRNASRRMGRKTNLPRGVTRHSCGRYQAQMTVSGKAHYLGLFDTAEAAEEQWNKKYRELFGDD